MVVRLFRPGDRITADRLNELIAEVKRISNLKVSGDLEMQNNKNGIFIGLKPAVTTIDEKYKQDKYYNEGTHWRRLSDLKRASVNSIWRILAIDDPEAEEEGEEAPEATYRIMFLLDPELMTWDDKKKVEPGAWGGWFTTAAGTGLDKEKAYFEHEIPEPTEKNIAQIQSFFLLTDDDRDPDNNPTRDGNYHTYFNMRDDGHVHRSVAKDGRIFFTDTDPGSDPDGVPIKGEMIGDPSLANTDTALGRETVEWRPQVKIPNLEIPGEVYAPRNAAGYSFPPLVRIPTSPVMAYEFGAIGKDEGWSAHYQPHQWIEQYGLAFLIKYSAENLTGSTKDAYMELDWKIVNAGGDLSTAALISSDFTIPVFNGYTEQDLNHLYVLFVSPIQYTDKSLVMVDLFARDAGHASDTLPNRLLIIEVKMIFYYSFIPP